MTDSDPESSIEGPEEGVVGIEGERIKAHKEGRFSEGDAGPQNAQRT